MKKIHFLFLLLCVEFSQAQEIIYPFPERLPASAQYEVYVNGKPAFVYDSPVPAAYCSFGMSGPVNVTVKAKRDIKWVDIRPLSRMINHSYKDSTIELRIDRPGQISIELNGSLKNPLFLFANPLETKRPDPADSNVIYFRAGKPHYAGLILLKDNQTIYLEPGAVVTGAVMARNAKNIRVAGYGVLNGTYNRYFSDSAIRSGDTASMRHPANGKYQRFLEFIDCEGVRIEGVTLHNSTTWQVVPVNSTNVAIEGIKIVSDQASDDGIDVVRSRNVRIRNCFIRTKDDCIVIKAHENYPEAVAVDSVLAEGCVLWNGIWGNNLEIGFELEANHIRNIRFVNNDCIHTEDGAVMSIHNAGRGTVSNIVFENIRVERATQKLFDLAIFRSQYSKDGTRDPEERKRLYLNGAWDGVLLVPAAERAYHARFRGQIKNIIFKDIKIVDGGMPYSIFSGFDSDHAVENVKIEGLQFHGKRITDWKAAKIFREHTNNISVR